MGYFHPKDGSDKLFNHMAYCDIVVLALAQLLLYHRGACH